MKPPVEFAPWLGVFETLRVVDGIPLFLAKHREELRRAMEALGIKSDFDFEKASDELPAKSGRWRWIVTSEGAKALFTVEEAQVVQPIALSVSAVRVGSCNWDARFKTLSHLNHMQAWRTGLTPEVILLNENGHIASASRANLFWRQGDELFTPSHDSGCRRGVVRSFVLNQRNVKMGQFPSSDLLKADEIFLTNSIKGIVSVNQLKTRTLKDFSAADGLREEYADEVAAQLKK